ncbi:MAG: gliding motility-associated C-terminal domain-containing protein [Saprospiraceae bacterium]|nr:gliding motility-associated C-terminal domain-containing protein [Saprospiraceae bacterium]
MHRTLYIKIRWSLSNLFAQQTIADHLPGCLSNPVFDYEECDGTPGTFAVVGNQIVVNDVVGNACCGGSPGGNSNSSFTYEAIDISSFMNVSISFDYSAANTTYENNSPATPLTVCANMNPPDNSHDQIVFQYSLNGGPFVNSLYVRGTTEADFTGTWNAGPLNGNSLVIRVIAANKADEEIFYFENLIVRGFPKPLSAGPDVATCGTNPVALNGTGTGSWSGGSGVFSNPNNALTNYTPTPGELNSLVVVTFTGKPATLGCEATYPAPFDQANVVVNSGPMGAIIGGAELCQGECSTVDIDISGGAEPFTLNMSLQIGSFPPFNFPAAGFTYMDEFTICYTNSTFPIPQYNAGNQTLSLPASAAGFTASLTLISITDNSGCPGTVTSIPLVFEFFPQPEANPASLEACDEGGGMATFDLNQASPTILGPESGIVRFFSDISLTNEEFSPYFGPSGTLYAVIESTDGCLSDPVELDLIVKPPGDVGNVMLSCNNAPNCTICDNDGVPGEIVDISISLPGSGSYEVNIDYLMNSTTFNIVQTVVGPFATISVNISGNAIFTLSSVTKIGECPDITGLGPNITVQYLIAPDVLPSAAITSCDPIVLPPIQVINPGPTTGYFSSPNGMGTAYSPGDIITVSTILFMYSGTPACFDQEAISIEIGGLTTYDEPADTSLCGILILPQISGNNVSSQTAYYTGPNGGGSAFAVGDTISTSTLLFIYDANNPNCQTNQPQFQVSITPPPQIKLDSAVYACSSYALPAITGTNLNGNQAYYNNPQSMGMPDTVGFQVTKTAAFYLFAGLPGCSDNDTLIVNVFQPVQYDTLPSVSACNSYTLTNITGVNVGPNAAYYTGLNGEGTIYMPGDAITIPTTFYIYDTTIRCQVNQPFFSVTVAPGPQLDAISDTAVCSQYILPPLTGNFLSASVAYFTGNNGTGTMYLPGDIIFGSLDLYAFDQGINCATQQAFNVEVQAKPNAGMASALSSCLAPNSSINLFNLLTGNYDLNGTWQESGTNYFNLSDPSNVLVGQNIPNGTYNFQYRVNSSACGPAISFPSLTFATAPEAGKDSVISVCKGSNEVLNLFTLLSGNSTSSGNWTASVPFSDPVNLMAGQLPIGSHSFSFEVTAAAGQNLMCRDTALFTINVVAGFTAGQDVSLNLCGGESADLSNYLSGESSVGIFTDRQNTGKLAGSLFNTTGLNPAPYNFYHIIPASAGCAADTSVIIVTVAARPNAGNDINKAYCELNSLKLDTLVQTQPGSTFVFSGAGATLVNNLFTPSIVGSYSVFYKVGNGQVCPADTATLFLNFQSRPLASLSSGLTWCDGADITISLQGDLGVEYFVILQNQTQFSAGNLGNFIWSQKIKLVNNTALLVVGPGLVTAGNKYHFTLVNMERNGCQYVLNAGEVSGAFTVNTTPITLVNKDLCRGDSLIIGNIIFDEFHISDTLKFSTQTSCDSLVSVKISLLEKSAFNYSFSSCDPGYFYEVQGQRFDKNNPQGSVLLAMANAAGCDSTVNVALSFNIPVTAMTAENALCLEASGNISISASTLSTPASILINGVNTWQASNWPFDFTIAPGIYSVTIRDQYNCETSQTISVNVDPAPYLAIIESPGAGGEIQLTIQSDVSLQNIQWHPANLVSCSNCERTTVLGPGLYAVGFEYAPGCRDSLAYQVVSAVVKEIYFPNVIREGIPGNNIFFPVKSDSYQADALSMSVYDRWGNRVFHRENFEMGKPEFGWDGTFNGKTLNPGVYVFTLIARQPDGQTSNYTGSITLVR